MANRVLFNRNHFFAHNKNKVDDRSRERLEGSHFNSYYTKVKGAIPFPGFLHFTLDMYIIILSVNQRGIK